MVKEMQEKTAQKSKKKVWLPIVIIAVCLGGYALIGNWWVKDTWQGLWYQPDEYVADIQNSLELTARGERIFKGTVPVVEGSEEFNADCNSHDKDTSLLGCYTGGKIYVYRITDEDLADANRVTMAHELLHAAWEQMGKREHKELKDLLAEAQNQNPDFFETELSVYDDAEWLEETYTRAGTKLENLPSELEAHYAKYFKNRQKIVNYYRGYQELFNKLKKRSEELYKQIESGRASIAERRAAYSKGIEQLNADIAEFNKCANTMGCFTTATFASARQALTDRDTALENERVDLNNTIDKFNLLVQELNSNQEKLGEMNDAMNSNVEEKQEK